MTVSVSGGFWPSDIKPDVQTPLAILKPRADELTQLTRGVLVGQVSTVTDKDKTWVFHNLDAVAPALNNLRQRLVTVKHPIRTPYPAFVDAQLVEESSLERVRQVIARGVPYLGPGAPSKERNEASSDEELIELLKEALNSPKMKSTLVSLIALANEAAREGNGEKPEESAGKQVGPNAEFDKPPPGEPDTAERPEE